MLAIIDSSKFNYKNKIGEFKYIYINDLVNNIRNNSISEIDAKKDLNTLNKIKNAEIIKYRKRNLGHKEILNLFNDLLNIILTDKTLISSKEENEELNENENENVNENENEIENDENENENENEDDDDDDIIKILIYSNEHDEETMNQNKKKIKS